jgi:hypothetical protein
MPGMSFPLPKILRQCCLLAGIVFLTQSCETYDPEAKRLRDAQIQMEPRGDWFIGRRYHTQGARFWGYVRRPGELWESSKLVIVNERQRLQPDRYQEAPASGPAHGFDHNHEYRLWGSFTGRTLYDPNADLELPEFLLSRYQMISASPGFLFDPRDKYNPRTLPPREVKIRGY